MTAVLVTLMLAQATGCAGSRPVLETAAQRAALFDAAAAVALLDSTAGVCEDVAVASWYLRGLAAARDAYGLGGSPESLEPVRGAIAALERHADVVPEAEIARLVLMAAAAAAQSERNEMALLLEHVVDLEARWITPGQPTRLPIAAHEIAGDLWLRVHRFQDARLAYARAAQRVGRTRRVILGLARTALRLDDVRATCDEYRALVDEWPTTAGEPLELVEARTFLQGPACS